MNEVKVTLINEADSVRLGARLAGIIHPGLRIYFSGELGSGKTFLVKALLYALGFEGVVKSPTYSLLESYVVSKLHLYHFDFYRFKDGREWEDLGFRQYFGPEAVTLVEWPEKASGIPSADIAITLQWENDMRVAKLSAHSLSGELCLSKLAGN